MTDHIIRQTIHAVESYLNALELFNRAMRNPSLTGGALGDELDRRHAAKMDARGLMVQRIDSLVTDLGDPHAVEGLLLLRCYVAERGGPENSFKAWPAVKARLGMLAVLGAGSSPNPNTVATQPTPAGLPFGLPPDALTPDQARLVLFVHERGNPTVREARAHCYPVRPEDNQEAMSELARRTKERLRAFGVELHRSQDRPYRYSLTPA